MRKNLLLLLLLMILGGASWWLYQKQKTNTTLSSYEGTFSIPDTSMIGKVTMVDKGGKHLLLERKQGFWMVNETHVAEPVMIKELLRTLSQVEIKFIPPATMIPNILSSLGTHGRRVDIWDTKGKLLKTYYVGGVTSDGTGTFFMMEGSNQPYVVTMKYFVGSVSVRYHLDEKDWRDLSLFPLHNKEIQSFSIEYPRQRDQSFIIENTPSGFTIKPFHDLTPRLEGQINTDLISTYLNNLGKYKIEGFINDSVQRDSISKLQPFCAIRVTTTDSSYFGIALHPKVPTDRRGFVLRDPQGNVLPVERYHVSTSWGDFMQVQNEPLKDLFTGYTHFFQ